MFSCMLKIEKRDLGKCDLVIVTRHFRASKHKIVRRKNQQKFASLAFRFEVKLSAKFEL